MGWPQLSIFDGSRLNYVRAVSYGPYSMGRGRRPARSSSGFQRPRAFWLGVAAVTAGVGLHVPMFLNAKSDHYMLAGMPWDGWMIAGMGLIVAGYAGVLYGLAPRFSRGG